MIDNEGNSTVIISNEREEAGRLEVHIENVMDFVVPLIKNGYQVLVQDDGEGIAIIQYLWADHMNYGGHRFAEVDEEGALVDNYFLDSQE